MVETKGARMTESVRITIARVLAIGGTVLVGFPLAAPLALSIVFLLAGRGLLFDYLMPGELAWVVLGGALVLGGASLLAHRRRELVLGALLATAVFFGATVWLTTATGLGSGDVAESDWSRAMVVAAYALYIAGALATFVAGILLCRDLFRRNARPHVPLAG